MRLPGINVEVGMETCGGNEDLYLELLQDYTTMTIKEELEKYLREKNYKDYCIRIHGFKGSSYSVGAIAIGDLAYEMEKLTKEGIPEEIQEMQKRLLEQYDRICQEFNRSGV